MGGSPGALSSGQGLLIFIIELAFMIFYFISLWKVFAKAGYPGVGAIIPIYNVYILLKMAKYSGWMIFVLMIPLVNIVVILLIYVRIANGFGKETGFGIGLLLLNPIFIPILAFSKADYNESRIY